MIEELILDFSDPVMPTPSGYPNGKSLVQPQSAVHPSNKFSMRPESAPFIPSFALSKTRSPVNVFKGTLEKSIHAISPSQIPRHGATNTITSFDLKRSQIDEWLEASTLPSNTVGHTQWTPKTQRTPRRQLSPTTPEDVVPNKRNRSLEKLTDVMEDIGASQLKPHTHSEGSQVESNPSMMQQEDSSNAERTDPLSSVLIKGGQSIHAPPPLVSNDRSTDLPINTQVSSLDLHQATRKSPTSDDSKIVEPSNSSSPTELGPLIPVELPKRKENCDVKSLGVPDFDPFSSLIDSEPEAKAASEHQPSSALKYHTVTPGTAAILTSKGVLPSPSNLLVALTSKSLARNLSSKPLKTLESTSLAPNVSEQSAVLTSEGLAPNPFKPTEIHAILVSNLSEPSVAIESANLAPNLASEPSKTLISNTNTSAHNLSEPSAAPVHENLTSNPSKPSPTKTYTSETHTPAESSPARTYDSATPSKAPLASTDKIITPPESSTAPTYKDLDSSKPSHILFQEMMLASKAFSEKTEAQRKAAAEKKPAEDAAVEGLESLTIEVS